MITGGVVAAVPAPARHRGPQRRWSRALAFLRRHWIVATLVALATAVRILVMVAYVPAFWYYGDSGEYILLSQDLQPHRLRPLGYPLLLKVLEPTHTFGTVVGLQHLAGLALGAGVYALALRRGLPRGVGSLAAVPVLFDSLQVDLEHFILTETLFTVLLVTAIGTLLWWERPGALACGTAGLLLAGAWFTRPIALAAMVVLAGYLLLRRIGWRALAAFLAAFAVPLAGVLLWVGERPSTYGPGSTSIFLYGRTAMIADCGRLALPPEQAPLCPDRPIDPDLAGRADWYIWVYLDPAIIRDPAMAPVLQGFAVNVIRQQPGDYAAVVARETAPYFVPWQYLGAGHDVINQWWTLPASVRDSNGAPQLASDGYAVYPVDVPDSPGATGLTAALHWYGTYARSPALFNSAAVIAAVIALFVARRRGRWRDGRDAGLLALLGVSLLVAQVAVSMYEPRQGIAILPLFCVTAALAWQGLRGPRGQGHGETPGPPDQNRPFPPIAGPSSSTDSR